MIRIRDLSVLEEVLHHNSFDLLSSLPAWGKNSCIKAPAAQLNNIERVVADLIRHQQTKQLIHHNVVDQCRGAVLKDVWELRFVREAFKQRQDHFDDVLHQFDLSAQRQLQVELVVEQLKARKTRIV